MLKKIIFVSTLMATVTTINLNSAHAAERYNSNGNINNATIDSKKFVKLDHGILHKDGTYIPPNVYPHYDILQIDEPLDPSDAINNNRTSNKFKIGNINNATIDSKKFVKLDHGILHKDGTYIPPNVYPHYDILQIDEPINVNDATDVNKSSYKTNHNANKGVSNSNNASNKVNYTNNNKAVPNNNNITNTTNYNKLNSNNAMNNDNSSNHYQAKANTQPKASTHSASVLPNTGVTQSNPLINVIAFSSILIGLFLVYRNRIKQ